MRTKRIGLVLISIIAVLTLGGRVWAADKYCTGVGTSISKAGLYLVKKGCHNKRCNVTRLSKEENNKVTKSRNYRIIYKTTQSSIQNSLIVIQLKYLNRKKIERRKISDVRLKRDRIDFVCFRERTDKVANKIPLNKEKPVNISYEIYDRYHRYGEVSDVEAVYLRDNFHIVYFNGSECISTRSLEQRVQFLMADRSNYPEGVSVFFHSLGVYSPAVAGTNDILSFEKLVVDLKRYKKRKQHRGCVSFDIRVPADEVHIGISDLEEKRTLAAPWEKPKLDTWILSTVAD